MGLGVVLRQFSRLKVKVDCLYLVNKIIIFYHQVKLDGDKKKDEEEGKDTKGIPEFWLTTFKNVEMLQEMIMEHDEPILQKLTDVSVTFSEKPMVSFWPAAVAQWLSLLILIKKKSWV